MEEVFKNISVYYTLFNLIGDLPFGSKIIEDLIKKYNSTVGK